MNLKLSAFVVVAFACVACSKEAPPAEKKAPEKKAPAAATQPATAAPAAKAWLKLDKFGLEIEMPAGATAMDGAGTSQTIRAPDGSCTVMLGKKEEFSAYPNYDRTIAEIEKGLMGKKKDMIKNEKVDESNWTIYYTKENMMDPTKVQHAVDIRKKIGADEYSCSRISDTEADAKCIMDACLSLKGGAGAPPAAGSAAASAAAPVSGAPAPASAAK